MNHGRFPPDGRRVHSISTSPETASPHRSPRLFRQPGVPAFKNGAKLTSEAIWALGAVQDCPREGADFCHEPSYDAPTRFGEIFVKVHTPTKIAWFDSPGFPAPFGAGLKRTDVRNSTAIRPKPGGGNYDTGNWLRASFKAWVLGTPGHDSWRWQETVPPRLRRGSCHRHG